MKKILLLIFLILISHYSGNLLASSTSEARQDFTYSESEEEEEEEESIEICNSHCCHREAKRGDTLCYLHRYGMQLRMFNLYLKIITQDNKGKIPAWLVRNFKEDLCKGISPIPVKSKLYKRLRKIAFKRRGLRL